MKLRNEWMTDYEYFGDEYPNNMLLDDVVRRFEIQKGSLEGKDALIDGVPERIVVQTHTNILNQVKYDKKVHCGMDSQVQTGSILEFDNKIWLVTSRVFDHMGYKTVSVLECLRTFTFYKPEIDPSSISVPYVIFDNIALTRMGAEENKYLAVPDSRMLIAVQDNKITRQIQRNDVFRFYDQDGIVDHYSVLDINRIRIPGLIILELEFNSQIQKLPDYNIIILNGQEIQVSLSSNLTIMVEVRDGDKVIPTPPLTYSSSNEQIAAIDENGNVIIYDVGNVKFTVSLASNLEVSATIDVEILPEEQINYIYKINGSSDIVKGFSSVYTAEKYNNGILVEDPEFEFKIISNSAPSTAYTLNVLNSNQCEIFANEVVYEIVLRATDIKTGEFVEKNIKLRNFF